MIACGRGLQNNEPRPGALLRLIDQTEAEWTHALKTALTPQTAASGVLKLLVLNSVEGANS